MSRCAIGSLITTLALALLPSLAHAEEDRTGLVWMSGEEIHSEFAGRKLEGLYPSRRAWSEVIHADGSTDYRSGGKQLAGKWWIDDPLFCFDYPPPGAGACFRVTRISRNCFELHTASPDPDGSGPPPRTPGVWNGRMWHADRPTTCETTPTV